MGWWKVEGTQNLVGDGPLDALGAAVAEVLAAYQSEFNRRPTAREWEALLLAALGADEPETRASDDGVVSRISVEFE